MTDQSLTVLAGVDLAWQSEKNPSAIASGHLTKDALNVDTVDPAVHGINDVFDRLVGIEGLRGVSVDAPLIIPNATGQRTCETQLGKVYGARGASCHTSNTERYPQASSVYLSERLLSLEFHHLCGDRWQLECYPHPAIIEVFGLPMRLKYKKGSVAEKKSGQKVLAKLIGSLDDSSVLRLSVSAEYDHILDEDWIESLRGKALKSNEDALDSIVCLYIAGLYAIDFTGQVFGNTDAGYVWVPQGVCT